MENQNNPTSRAYQMISSTLISIRRTRDYVSKTNHRCKNVLLNIISVLEETLLSDVEHLVNNVPLLSITMYLLDTQKELIRIKHIASN